MMELKTAGWRSKKYSVTGRTGVAGVRPGERVGVGVGVGVDRSGEAEGGGGLEELGVDGRQAGEAGVGDGAQGGQPRLVPHPAHVQHDARLALDVQTRPGVLRPAPLRRRRPRPLPHLPGPAGGARRRQPVRPSIGVLSFRLQPVT